ncbi:hypothetical protein BESB_068020 [Besnoitia besnoiti]|uniref:AP2/ERF domain-containing protein n=1 Tax=Besnoitia besnoiti TaxID=94643 RepID=A0A2A9MA42_BESBE|nr:hypothetical protein BESB_068020 [Besnoitia besnoiti]PFH34769.1 hypothetical protein BESB_068020 [Besnoitia besnoiti]
MDVPNARLCAMSDEGSSARARATPPLASGQQGLSGKKGDSLFSTLPHSEAAAMALRERDLKGRAERPNGEKEGAEAGQAQSHFLHHPGSAACVRAESRLQSSGRGAGEGAGELAEGGLQTSVSVSVLGSSGDLRRAEIGSELPAPDAESVNGEKREARTGKVAASGGTVDRPCASSLRVLVQKGLLEASLTVRQGVHSAAWEPSSQEQEREGKEKEKIEGNWADGPAANDRVKVHRDRGCVEADDRDDDRRTGEDGLATSPSFPPSKTCDSVCTRGRKAGSVMLCFSDDGGEPLPAEEGFACASASSPSSSLASSSPSCSLVSLCSSGSSPMPTSESSSSPSFTCLPSPFPASSPSAAADRSASPAGAAIPLSFSPSSSSLAAAAASSRVSTASPHSCAGLDAGDNTLASAQNAVEEPVARRTRRARASSLSASPSSSSSPSSASQLSVAPSASDSCSTSPSFAAALCGPTKRGMRDRRSSRLPLGSDEGEGGEAGEENERAFRAQAAGVSAFDEPSEPPSQWDQIIQCRRREALERESGRKAFGEFPLASRLLRQPPGSSTLPLVALWSLCDALARKETSDGGDVDCVVSWKEENMTRGGDEDMRAASVFLAKSNPRAGEGGWAAEGRASTGDPRAASPSSDVRGALCGRGPRRPEGQDACREAEGEARGTASARDANPSPDVNGSEGRGDSGADLAPKDAIQLHVEPRESGQGVGERRSEQTDAGARDVEEERERHSVQEAGGSSSSINIVLPADEPCPESIVDHDIGAHAPADPRDLLSLPCPFIGSEECLPSSPALTQIRADGPGSPSCSSARPLASPPASSLRTASSASPDSAASASSLSLEDALKMGVFLAGSWPASARPRADENGGGWPLGPFRSGETSAHVLSGDDTRSGRREDSPATASPSEALRHSQISLQLALIRTLLSREFARRPRLSSWLHEGSSSSRATEAGSSLGVSAGAGDSSAPALEARRVRLLRAADCCARDERHRRGGVQIGETELPDPKRRRTTASDNKAATDADKDSKGEERECTAGPPQAKEAGDAGQASDGGEEEDRLAQQKDTRCRGAGEDPHTASKHGCTPPLEESDVELRASSCCETHANTHLRERLERLRAGQAEADRAVALASIKFLRERIDEALYRMELASSLNAAVRKSELKRRPGTGSKDGGDASEAANEGAARAEGEDEGRAAQDRGESEPGAPQGSHLRPRTQEEGVNTPAPANSPVKEEIRESGGPGERSEQFTQGGRSPAEKRAGSEQLDMPDAEGKGHSTERGPGDEADLKEQEENGSREVCRSTAARGTGSLPIAEAMGASSDSREAQKSARAEEGSPLPPCASSPSSQPTLLLSRSPSPLEHRASCASSPVERGGGREGREDSSETSQQPPPCDALAEGQRRACVAREAAKLHDLLTHGMHSRLMRLSMLREALSDVSLLMEDLRAEFPRVYRQSLRRFLAKDRGRVTFTRQPPTLEDAARNFGDMCRDADARHLPESAGKRETTRGDLTKPEDEQQPLGDLNAAEGRPARGRRRTPQRPSSPAASDLPSRLRSASSTSSSCSTAASVSCGAPLPSASSSAASSLPSSPASLPGSGAALASSVKSGGPFLPSAVVRPAVAERVRRCTDFTPGKALSDWLSRHPSPRLPSSTSSGDSSSGLASAAAAEPLSAVDAASAASSVSRAGDASPAPVSNSASPVSPSPFACSTFSSSSSSLASPSLRLPRPSLLSWEDWLDDPLNGPRAKTDAPRVESMMRAYHASLLEETREAAFHVLATDAPHVTLSPPGRASDPASRRLRTNASSTLAATCSSSAASSGPPGQVTASRGGAPFGAPSLPPPTRLASSPSGAASRWQLPGVPPRAHAPRSDRWVDTLQTAAEEAVRRRWEKSPAPLPYFFDPFCPPSLLPALRRYDPPAYAASSLLFTSPSLPLSGEASASPSASGAVASRAPSLAASAPGARETGDASALRAHLSRFVPRWCLQGSATEGSGAAERRLAGSTRVSSPLQRREEARNRMRGESAASPSGAAASAEAPRKADDIPVDLYEGRERVRGVAFCRSTKYWICSTMENGKQKCKYFSAKQFGFEGARRQAILQRQAWKKDVRPGLLEILEAEEAAAAHSASSAALSPSSSSPASAASGASASASASASCSSPGSASRPLTCEAHASGAGMKSEARSATARDSRARRDDEKTSAADGSSEGAAGRQREGDAEAGAADAAAKKARRDDEAPPQTLAGGVGEEEEPARKRRREAEEAERPVRGVRVSPRNQNKTNELPLRLPQAPRREEDAAVEAGAQERSLHTASPVKLDIVDAASRSPVSLSSVPPSGASVASLASDPSASAACKPDRLLPVKNEREPDASLVEASQVDNSYPGAAVFAVSGSSSSPFPAPEGREALTLASPSPLPQAEPAASRRLRRRSPSRAEEEPPKETGEPFTEGLDEADEDTEPDKETGRGGRRKRRQREESRAANLLRASRHGGNEDAKESLESAKHEEGLGEQGERGSERTRKEKIKLRSNSCPQRTGLLRDPNELDETTKIPPGFDLHSDSDFFTENEEDQDEERRLLQGASSGSSSSSTCPTPTLSRSLSSPLLASPTLTSSSPSFSPPSSFPPSSSASSSCLSVSPPASCSSPALSSPSVVSCPSTSASRGAALTFPLEEGAQPSPQQEEELEDRDCDSGGLKASGASGADAGAAAAAALSQRRVRPGAAPASLVCGDAHGSGRAEPTEGKTEDADREDDADRKEKGKSLSTAEALVQLSRKVTFNVKIPGIGFHKGVESWVCMWKDVEGRSISRYFRCSRFGFRRSYKMSVCTLLRHAPPLAAWKAIVALEEIKRRRRESRLALEKPGKAASRSFKRTLLRAGLGLTERDVPPAFRELQRKLRETSLSAEERKSGDAQGGEDGAPEAREKPEESPPPSQNAEQPSDRADDGARSAAATAGGEQHRGRRQGRRDAREEAEEDAVKTLPEVGGKKASRDEGDRTKEDPSAAGGLLGESEEGKFHGHAEPDAAAAKEMQAADAADARGRNEEIADVPSAKRGKGGSRAESNNRQRHAPEATSPQDEKGKEASRQTDSRRAAAAVQGAGGVEAPQASPSCDETLPTQPAGAKADSEPRPARFPHVENEGLNAHAARALDRATARTESPPAGTPEADTGKDPGDGGALETEGRTNAKDPSCEARTRGQGQEKAGAHVGAPAGEKAEGQGAGRGARESGAVVEDEEKDCASEGRGGGEEREKRSRRGARARAGGNDELASCAADGRGETQMKAEAEAAAASGASGVEGPLEAGRERQGRRSAKRDGLARSEQQPPRDTEEERLRKRRKDACWLGLLQKDEEAEFQRALRRERRRREGSSGTKKEPGRQREPADNQAPTEGEEKLRETQCGRRVEGQDETMRERRDARTPLERGRSPRESLCVPREDFGQSPSSSSSPSSPSSPFSSCSSFSSVISSPSSSSKDSSSSASSPFSDRSARARSPPPRSALRVSASASGSPPPAAGGRSRRFLCVAAASSSAVSAASSSPDASSAPDASAATCLSTGRPAALPSSACVPAPAHAARGGASRRSAPDPDAGTSVGASPSEVLDGANAASEVRLSNRTPSAFSLPAETASPSPASSQIYPRTAGAPRGASDGDTVAREEICARAEGAKARSPAEEPKPREGTETREREDAGRGNDVEKPEEGRDKTDNEERQSGRRSTRTRRQRQP